MPDRPSTRLAARGALLIAATAWTACWSQRIATEETNAPEQRPSVTRTSSANPTDREPTAPQIPDVDLGGTAYRAPKTLSQALENGCLIVGRDKAPAASIGDTALLRLVLPYGRASEPRVGVTELAAALIVSATGGADGQPSLETRIAALGGDIRHVVGARATQIDIVTPRESWGAALDALLTVVRTPPSGAAEVEAVRKNALERLRARATTPNFDGLVRLETERNGSSATRDRAGLEDRTVAEVELYAKVMCQPIRSALIAWVPEVDHRTLLERARTAAADWVGSEESAARTVRPIALADRIQWVPTAASAPGNFVEFGLLIPEAPLNEAGGLEERVLLECLSSGGIDGRLGLRWKQLRQASPVGVRAQRIRDGGASYRLLRGIVSPSGVVPVWDSVLDARASMSREPPTGDELNRALGRVRLQLLSTLADPRRWLDHATTEALSGGKPADLAAALERLRHASALDLSAGGLRLERAGATLAVLGGEPESPIDARIEVRTDAFLPPENASVPRDDTQQRAGAVELLDIAARAMGGKLRLSGFRGYAMASRQSSDVGVDLEEKVWFAGDRLRRIRTVLATRIESVFQPGGSFERAGGTRLDLEPIERDAALETARIDPLSIVAAHCRGEMQFRYTANRTIGGRELAVLDRVGSGPDLRVFVDLQSGLIRQIESSRLQAGLGVVHERRTYFDYRPVDGVRAPFHITIQVDDNRHPRTVEVVDFSPRQPPEAALRADGPTKIGARTRR